MRNYNRLILTICVSLTLPACGTTRRFVDQPQLTIDGFDNTPRQATAQLFDEVTPYHVSLCEADPISKACKRGSDGVRANGVGGLFIPLLLNVSGMTISMQSPSGSGWAIDAAVQSKADGIPPLCRTAHGHILLRDNNTITVQLHNFYCNWLAVGNVIVNTDFSVDHIDSQNRVFNGFYKITFHGTGNAVGSGYYRAVIVLGHPKNLAPQTKDQDGDS
jgi:hypothetical protein